MRGVLDSFWKLLGRGEQSVLVRLGAFRGSFSHRAAREVSGASLFFLEGLVLRAFLQRQEPGYYKLHELIRQYLVAKLANQPVRQRETQARHARYFGKVLAELHTGLGWREIPALEKMTYKLENGRIAWEWALANRDADLLLKVGRSLSYFYQYRGFIQEGEREFGRALECFQEGGEAHLIGWLLLEKAVFLNLKGSTDEAHRCLQQALELLGSNRNIEAYLQELIYRTRGDILRKKGKYAAARDEFQKMLELGQHSGDQHLQVQALIGLARAGLVMQDFDALDYYCQQALTLETVKANPNQAQFFFSMLGRGERDRGRADKALYYLKRARETLPANASPQSTGILFSYEGLVYRLVGDYDTAQRRFEEALTYHKDPQALFDQMYCLSYLGMLFHLKGDNERAIEYCRRALAMSEQVHLVKMKCDTLTRLGRSQTALGDYIPAEEVFSQALELGRETKQTDTIVDALAGLVELWTTLPVSPDELAERTYELRDWVLGTDKPLPIGASEVLRPYLVCYRALLKLNDLAEAHALLQLMQAKLWQIAKGIEDADLRTAFLNRKDVHAEIRQLAALL